VFISANTSIRQTCDTEVLSCTGATETPRCEQAAVYALLGCAASSACHPTPASSRSFWIWCLLLSTHTEYRRLHHESAALFFVPSLIPARENSEKCFIENTLLIVEVVYSIGDSTTRGRDHTICDRAYPSAKTISRRTHQCKWKMGEASSETHHILSVKKRCSPAASVFTGPKKISVACTSTRTPVHGRLLRLPPVLVAGSWVFVRC
jgi:hypothetical protein